MTVSEAGWVDTGSFRPNRGQFPIRVERHLNSFVGAHLPGVTTVTTATRYYALHGLVATIAQDEGLDESSTIDLLRRSEALLACVTRRHTPHPSHDSAAPAPHGIDAIVRSAKLGDGFDLVKAAKVYSDQKWAYANPYRGSELTLKVLAPGGFRPGEWYADKPARGVLGHLIEAARHTDEVTDATLDELSGVCLCTTPRSEDGAWLAELLSGDSTQPHDRPTVGGLLWQFGRMTRVATSVGDVTSANTLANLVMFDPALRDDPRLMGMVAPERWRGVLLRKESVYAWRLVWRTIHNLVDGALPVDDLVGTFADLLSELTVSQFQASLPPHVDSQGKPLAAERALADLPELERRFAQLMIGASRIEYLTPEELRGFRGPEEHTRGQWEELSPGWVAEKLTTFRDQSLRDLGRDLAKTLIYRSQRVALWKSRFDPRTQTLSFPARLHVRDGIAVRIYGETAPDPATRIPQYLSIARQAGMFVVNDKGHFALGPNGGRLE
jgi:hypothetical protein